MDKTDRVEKTYIVEVWHNGELFFKTTADDKAKLKNLDRELAQRFLESEGYRVISWEVTTNHRYVSPYEIWK